MIPMEHLERWARLGLAARLALRVYADSPSPNCGGSPTSRSMPVCLNQPSVTFPNGGWATTIKRQ